MIRYILGLFFLLSSHYTAFGQGIAFEKGTWESVLAKAQQENKPIFVDAYTTWCGCKWMAKEVFPQEMVATYINTHFVAYKMDMEKGEGPAFAAANKVNAFPTLLYFNSEGLLLHKAAGARNAEQLIQLCQDAMDPAKQVSTYQSRFEEGVRDTDFLKQYVSVLAESGEDFSEPFGLYWEQVSAEERHSAEMLAMLAGITEDFSDIESPWTTYLMDNRAAYNATTEPSIVNYYLLQAYTYHTYYLAQLEDNAETKAQIATLLKRYPEGQQDFKARWAFYRAALETPPNKKKVARTRKRYLKATIDMGELDELAWNMLSEGEPSKQELKEALRWMERSTAADAHYYNTHIKAAILHRLGKEKEAIAAARQAIELSKELDLNEEEIEQTYILLQEMGAAAE